jgi:hypothetical protein
VHRTKEFNFTRLHASPDLPIRGDRETMVDHLHGRLEAKRLMSGSILTTCFWMAFSIAQVSANLLVKLVLRERTRGEILSYFKVSGESADSIHSAYLQADNERHARESSLTATRIAR